jgi:hypothetical protein
VKKNAWILGGIFIFLTGCSALKKTVPYGTVDKKMTSKKLIDSFEKSPLDFDTAAVRLQALLESDRKRQQINLSVRLKNQETFWASASIVIPVAKVRVTQKGIQFYEKVGRTYFDGDFSLLSNFLGTEITQQKLQNLLLGQPVAPLSSKKWELTYQKNQYVLTSKRSRTPLQETYHLSAENFRLAEQHLEQPQQNRSLKVRYLDYTQVKGQWIPSKVVFVSSINQKQSILTLTYHSVALNEHLRFPFRIPNGYTPIEL